MLLCVPGDLYHVTVCDRRPVLCYCVTGRLYHLSGEIPVVLIGSQVSINADTTINICITKRCFNEGW
jgi:hypothetical protein